GQHAARHDPPEPAAEDRRGGRAVVRGPGRGDPARRPAARRRRGPPRAPHRAARVRGRGPPLVRRAGGALTISPAARLAVWAAAVLALPLGARACLEHRIATGLEPALSRALGAEASVGGAEAGLTGTLALRVVALGVVLAADA